MGDPYGGGEYQFWLSIVEALKVESNRHNFHIVLFADKEEWKFLADKYHLEFEVYNPENRKINKAINKIMKCLLPTELYKKGCRFWFGHYGILIQYDIDFWISSNPGDVTRDLQIKSISPIFDLMHRYEPQFEEVQINQEWRERSFKKICRYASIVLADSQVGKNQIMECYGEKSVNLSEKIKILPFIPADYVYDVKGIMPVPDTGFDRYIFYPAQFWTHKNHRNLLLAISMLKKKGMIVNLVCVGSKKNAQENIEELIQEEHLEEQVKIFGYVSNDKVVALYQHARALVMPTFFGPTNIPQLEAFELGCPVATSNVYGIPDQVGEAALLFNPKSVEEIAQCVEELWTNDGLCDRLKKKGKKRSLLWGRAQYAATLAKYIDELWEESHGGVS